MQGVPAFYYPIFAGSLIIPPGRIWRGLANVKTADLRRHKKEHCVAVFFCGMMLVERMGKEVGMAVRSVVAQTIDTAGQEAQKSSKTSYPLIKRAVYYGSRLISAQKNTVFVNSHYEKIRKVYSIWIQMNAGKEKANTITEYSISEKNIVGAVKEKKSSYDLMTVIMVGLGDAQTADRPILRLLDILLSAETKPDAKKAVLEKDFDIPMTSAMSEEANIMCNLGEGIREQAYEQGYEQATRKAWMEAVLNLMKSLKLSAEEAIDALAVPDEERQSLLERIDEELAVR